MTGVVLFGARGRMGRMITDEFAAKADLKIVAGVESSTHPDVGKSPDGFPLYSDPRRLPDADVWVDFSLAAPAVLHAELAADKRMPLIVAATGFSENQISGLVKCSRKCPLLYAPNLSIGIGVMDRIIGDAARILGEDFDSSVVEFHHSAKLDSPSGTALRLMERISTEGKSQPKIAAMRLGGAIGEHQVRFVGENEELIITHRAFSRRAFSQGLERAIRFLSGKKPGFYTLRELYSSV